MDRWDIIKAARSYLGTPFHHLGRVKGVGVDCVGMVAGVLSSMGVPYVDLPVYSRQPDGFTLERELDSCLVAIDRHHILPGDVLSFWYQYRNKPCHVGIATDIGVIHTNAAIGKVVEHHLDDFWAKRISRVYQLPGVEPTFTPKSNRDKIESLVRPSMSGECCG